MCNYSCVIFSALQKHWRTDKSNRNHVMELQTIQRTHVCFSTAKMKHWHSECGQREQFLPLIPSVIDPALSLLLKLVAVVFLSQICSASSCEINANLPMNCWIQLITEMTEQQQQEEESGLPRMVHSQAWHWQDEWAWEVEQSQVALVLTKDWRQTPQVLPQAQTIQLQGIVKGWKEVQVLGWWWQSKRWPQQEGQAQWDTCSRLGKALMVRLVKDAQTMILKVIKQWTTFSILLLNFTQSPC